MKGNEKFEGYLIPNEYLEGIKGGMSVETRSATDCPSCNTGKPVLGTRNIPPTYVCTGCGCVWTIVLSGGEYYVKIIRDGRK